MLTQTVAQGYANTETGVSYGALAVTPISLSASNPKLLWGIDLLKIIEYASIAIWAA